MGYLVQWECLLSTHGSEMGEEDLGIGDTSGVLYWHRFSVTDMRLSAGMIEDAVGAVTLLDNFRFRIVPLAKGDVTTPVSMVTTTDSEHFFN